MAETIGLLVLDAIGVAGLPGIAGFGTVAATTFGGIGITTVIGGAAILGASIGLNYALATRPALPTPSDGSQPLKQGIPPRIRGYWINRLAGYYMLFEAAGAPGADTSYDVMAFHSGPIDSIMGLYLHDDPIVVSPSISAGGFATVQNTYGDGRYGGGRIQLEARLGAASQTALTSFTSDPLISGIWNSSHQGNGIAYVGLKCGNLPTVGGFTNTYPHQLPLLSVVAKCSPVWDPRDVTQSQTDPTTWKPSPNPVLQLIDYLTLDDGGMGLEYATVIAPNIAQWINEANLCDAQVPFWRGGTEPRYQSAGWYTFDNKPEDVIGGILSTCDGYLAESGDGTLSLTVGVYRAPTDPPLTEKHIFGFALNYGTADEQTVNQLDVSLTWPPGNYVEIQVDPVRDEAAISLTGIIRSQALDLKWVQSDGQSTRLATRALQRLNPSMSGSFTTSLYGLRYLGKRWIPVQYPFVSGLQNAVVEIQSAEVDLMGGRIVWNFILVNATSIEAFVPPTSDPIVAISVVNNISDDAGVYLTDDLSSPLTAI